MQHYLQIQELCSSRELGDQKLKVVNENISSLSCDLEGAKEQISSLEHQLEQRNEVVTEFRLTIQVTRDCDAMLYTSLD